MTHERLKILFVVAEAFPFAKVGGLADVGGALPKALAALGHDVRLLLPGYPSVGKGLSVLSLGLPLGNAGGERTDVRRHGLHHGVDVYTIHHDRYFERDAVYGYVDDLVVPFVVFSKAAVALAAAWAGAGWAPDVVHCHDWHTALIPQELRLGAHRGALDQTAALLTIHNLAYQGRLNLEAEALVGLPGATAPSLLGRGIEFAEIVTTVSSRYRDEILTPQHGMGLDPLLRARRRDLHGILNGLDYAEFDPATDPYIAAPYDAGSLQQKAVNKLTLQRRSSLPLAADRPVVGMVARLVDQKGIDLLVPQVNEIVALGAQVVVMGLGERHYQEALAAAAVRHPQAVAYHATGDEAPARLVYAGADLFLTPSSFEPCGLAPLIALRYGAIPVVRRTGGLAETVPDYRRDRQRGLGFTFGRRCGCRLVEAIGAALRVYNCADEWRALQRRAMATDYSWGRASRAYERLYHQAIVRRRRQYAGIAHRTTEAVCVAPRERPAGPPVPLALVHHANQHLITRGYTDRQGIAAIVQGYAALLRLHARSAVPLHLHLSGTLLEAAAWHCPWFLDLVKELRVQGLLTLVGGTYAENVMPLFSPDVNRRQLQELFWLYRHHLDCPPEEIALCWIPERVWDTGRLAPVLTSRRLPNGGYRAVLLDDRLVFASREPDDGREGDAGSPRARFDSAAPYWPDQRPNAPAGWPEPLDPHHARQLVQASSAYRIAGGNGLTLLPISGHLRYRIPPASETDLQHIEELVRSLGSRRSLVADSPQRHLLVYADDMEKTAGVGGWNEDALERYGHFLRWLTSRRDVAPVRLTDWLARNAPAGEALPERRVEPGTYYELAQGWRAGEDYRGWAQSRAWQPYRRMLDGAEAALRDAARAGADRRLLRLGWKHLLASTYETAWHDPAVEQRGAGPALRPGGGTRAPAPWARAVASHSRSTLVIAAAARWFHRDTRPVSVEVADVDADGEAEVVLRNEHLYAVLAPAHGGRLIYLFALTQRGGALVIGNPTDDWNFQEALNRAMDQPANHPGALADAGYQHDRYRVARAEGVTGAAFRECGALVELENVEPGSRLRGARKRLVLFASAPALTVCYERPATLARLAVEACLSPDYYRLLRRGRRPRAHDGEGWRGYRLGTAAAWLALVPGEGTTWIDPVQAEAGHGLNVRLRADSPHFHLLVGAGAAGEACIRQLVAGARTAVHDLLVPAARRFVPAVPRAA